MAVQPIIAAHTQHSICVPRCRRTSAAKRRRLTVPCRLIENAVAMDRFRKYCSICRLCYFEGIEAGAMEE